MIVRPMIALASLALAAEPAQAASYGCGRAVRGDGRFAAVLVARDAVASGTATRPAAGAPVRAALVICTAKACAAPVDLATTQPVALAWDGERLVLFSDATLALDGLDRAAGYDVQVRPLAASASVQNPVRFAADTCHRRPGAG